MWPSAGFARAGSGSEHAHARATTHNANRPAEKSEQQAVYRLRILVEPAWAYWRKVLSLTKNPIALKCLELFSWKADPIVAVIDMADFSMLTNRKSGGRKAEREESAERTTGSPLCT
jgi:hypothetical protein